MAYTQRLNTKVNGIRLIKECLPNAKSGKRTNYLLVNTLNGYELVISANTLKQILSGKKSVSKVISNKINRKGEKYKTIKFWVLR